MCSRRARIRPAVLLETNTTTSASATIISTISSSKTAISPTSETPNRKRLKNWRRPTGPLSPEDLKLAMSMVSGDGERKDDENRRFEDDEREQRVRNNADCVDGDMTDSTTSRERSLLSVKADATDGCMDAENERPLTSAIESGSCKSTRMEAVIFRENRYSQQVSTCIPDYKKVEQFQLYEMEKAENDRLRSVVTQLESLLEHGPYEDPKECEAGVHLFDAHTQAMAIRLAQLEEEVKAVETLRADNQRLKEENGALIRVISKLSK